ncbi:hypothetical protein RRG08_029367 [Elysia crispata]|uniref:Uncharacterized protein n=1 Tax=Elysia crispata TaxID=231223 RepID=A0AAE1EBP6_9GAST|nr:hypothetical protein RRG08_029367 [Elysia crispata]
MTWRLRGKRVGMERIYRGGLTTKEKEKEGSKDTDTPDPVSDTRQMTGSTPASQCLDQLLPEPVQFRNVRILSSELLDSCTDLDASDVTQYQTSGWVLTLGKPSLDVINGFFPDPLVTNNGLVTSFRDLRGVIDVAISGGHHQRYLVAKSPVRRFETAKRMRANSCNSETCEDSRLRDNITCNYLTTKHLPSTCLPDMLLLLIETVHPG